MDLALRLTGALHDVRFDAPRTVYGLLDCRLALILDDAARMLAAMNVTAVRVNNMYRPASKLPPKNAGGSPRVSQHAAGLAVDIVGFELASGTSIEIERDFHAVAGSPPCGPEARIDATDVASRSLREISCALARGGFCHHLFMPSYDEAHRNHLHCDIKPGSDEFDIR
jgi:hypothetical protein